MGRRQASENLDFTYVEKWDPATETTSKIFEPTGVVAGARNATPYYGDLLGDWREEILAETADHTALRLYTTTEPTKTCIYTLAQNAEYRLGWTVRGYLQSTYTELLPRHRDPSGPEAVDHPPGRSRPK